MLSNSNLSPLFTTTTPSTPVVDAFPLATAQFDSALAQFLWGTTRSTEYARASILVLAVFLVVFMVWLVKRFAHGSAAPSHHPHHHHHHHRYFHHSSNYGVNLLHHPQTVRISTTVALPLEKSAAVQSVGPSSVTAVTTPTVLAPTAVTTTTTATTTPVTNPGDSGHSAHLSSVPSANTNRDLSLELSKINVPTPAMTPHNGSAASLVPPPASSSSSSSPRASSEEMGLMDLLYSTCPALTDPDKAVFKPSKWLFNGHLQTAAVTKMEILKGYDVDYSRETVSLPDGGTVALDWFPSLEVNPDPNLPIIFILHGLTGGSHEFYVRSLVKTITDARHGCRVIVLNNRGCGFSEILTPKLYSAGYTDDLRFVLQRLRNQFPRTTPIIGVGFSLGSNILVKFVGEEGDRCVLKAAVSVGNPFNLLKASEVLNDGFWGSLVYTRVMKNQLLRFFNRHKHMFVESDFDLDLASVAKSKTVRDFDDLVTRRVFGYATVQDYYTSASSGPYVPRVRIPLLCLNSLDDPVCSAQSIPYRAIRENPYTVLATTASGGHLGWFEAGSDGNRVRPWSIDPISEFCMAMTRVDTVYSPVAPPTNTTTTAAVAAS